MRHTLFAVLTGLSLSLGAPLPAVAQSFAPAITVDDAVITGFELDQRSRFLTLLNAPGDTDQLAREQLIEEKLKLKAAAQMGIAATEKAVLDGMEEFAGRANLTREEFTTALERGGVSEQAFRDFVVAGVIWRQVVRARFGNRADVSEAEIDRALTRQAAGGNVRVLLSEIIMPAPPQQAAAVRERANRISQIRSFDAFAAEARRYSATASRGRGGRLEWKSLDELPAQLHPLLLALSPGEVTQPIPLPKAIALFQLRDIEETAYSPPVWSEIEYAAFYMPGGRSEATLKQAARIAARTDTCDDLYGVAKGLPPERLERGKLAPENIPTDIAFELSKLDPGEISTALTRADGQTLVLLMLCGRTTAAAAEASRKDISLGLANQRLAAYAEGYLELLKANARIVTR